MLDKITYLLREKCIQIPKIIFYNYKDLNINEQDLIVLIYLINIDDKTFNPASIVGNLKMELNAVMTSVGNLMNSNLMALDTINNNGLREIVNLDGLYRKIAIILTNEPKNDTNLYAKFETELGRTISPAEM